jgi:hypothetical protein
MTKIVGRSLQGNTSRQKEKRKRKKIKPVAASDKRVPNTHGGDYRLLQH